MKSVNNQTEYDDKLFYQTVSSSIQKLFISPVKPPFSFEQIDLTKDSQINLYQLKTEKASPVRAVADGTVVLIKKLDENEIALSIKHDTGIYTNYICIQNPKVTTVGTQLKQGEELGLTTDSTIFEILISPAAVFQDN